MVTLMLAEPPSGRLIAVAGSCRLCSGSAAAAATILVSDLRRRGHAIASSREIACAVLRRSIPVERVVVQ
jgi:hypothetical protein